ncbi:MAG: CopG family transcriptional regulator [Planctomycetota bacterium]
MRNKLYETMGGNLKNRVRMSVTLTPELADRVRKLAQERQESVSAIVEEALNQQLPHQEELTRVQNSPLTDAVINQLLQPEVLARAMKLAGHEVDQSTENDDVLPARIKTKKGQLK